MFAVSSVLLVELKAVLVEVSLPGALKRLVAVGIDTFDLCASWLVGAVAFGADTRLGVEEDVPKSKRPLALCEGPLRVDGAAMPKMKPVVLEDEGCTAVPKAEPVVVVEDEGCTAVPNIELVVVEDESCTSAVEVVSGVWVSDGEETLRNSLPVVAEGKDSSVPNE